MILLNHQILLTHLTTTFWGIYWEWDIHTYHALRGAWPSGRRADLGSLAQAHDQLHTGISVTSLRLADHHRNSPRIARNQTKIDCHESSIVGGLQIVEGWGLCEELVASFCCCRRGGRVAKCDREHDIQRLVELLECAMDGVSAADMAQRLKRTQSDIDRPFLAAASPNRCFSSVVSRTSRYSDRPWFGRPRFGFFVMG